MVSHTPAEFGGHCGSEDIMILVCNVILQDRVTKRYNMGQRDSSRLVTILPSLLDIGTVVVEICFFSLSRDLAKPLDQRLGYICKSHSKLVTILPSLVARGTVVVEV